MTTSETKSRNQDPFIILAGLDPATPREAVAQWSEQAMQSFNDGSALEVSFHDSFLRSLVGSTGLALWKQQDNDRSNADPGLALLRENKVVRNAATGLHQLNIPGNSVSSLNARIFTDCRQPLAGGKAVPIVHHIVDMQIKTAVDIPLFVFSPKVLEDGSKLQPIETKGRWFRFPLEEVSLTLV